MIKKIISILTSFTFLICGLSVYAKGEPSDWAAGSIEKAETYGFSFESSISSEYTEPITREELCKIILSIYDSVVETKYFAKGKSPFSDTDTEEVTALYELGIVSGLGESLFEPERGVTRQEIAKFLGLLYSSASGRKNIAVDEENIKKFTDYEEIGEWAYPYIAFLIEENILNGYEDGSFRPQDEVTVEQAISLAVRLFEKMTGIETEPEAPEISQIPQISQIIGNLNSLNSSPKSQYARKVEIEQKTAESGITISSDGYTATANFGKVGNYEISVTEQRDSYYENSIPAAPYIEDTVVGAAEYSFEINPSRIYRISTNSGGYAEFVTAHPDSASNRAEVESYGQITTKEEADALQVEIEIPVWRLQGGERVSGKTTLMVHTAIADRVKAIFEEIYNGGEQFPIMDIGCYAWRDPMGSGRLSEHNLGTAIDINAEQNYCIYPDGSTVGSHWTPYDDPLSITPYGEVMNIFEKYGFTWGGDAWRSPNDYMHFSYMGT